jgi:hypothetical protein
LRLLPGLHYVVIYFGLLLSVALLWFLTNVSGTYIRPIFRVQFSLTLRKGRIYGSETLDKNQRKAKLGYKPKVINTDPMAYQLMLTFLLTSMSVWKEVIAETRGLIQVMYLGCLPTFNVHSFLDLKHFAFIAFKIRLLTVRTMTVHRGYVFLPVAVRMHFLWRKELENKLNCTLTYAYEYNSKFVKIPKGSFLKRTASSFTPIRNR